MKRISTYLLLFLAFVLKSIYICADTEFQLTQFTTADGLPNNTVRHIIQDTNGNIWLCTSNGLSRYDGSTFHNYHPIRNSKEASLNDQRTQKVFEHDGHIWISTAKGFSCFDLKTSSFIDYEKKGIKVPDFPKDNIHKITDKQGRTWKVTEDDGLYIINNKTGESEHFSINTKNNPLPTNALKCIFMDKDGTIWIGTDNLGLSQIKVVQNDGVNYMLEGENIRMLMHLGKDRIAVGNRSGDVWIYDSGLKSIISSYKREKNTYCVLLDKDNNLWEGTKGAGIYFNGEQMTDSPYKDIYAFLQDRKGNMWIGTFGGGLVCNGNTYLTDDNGSMHIRSLIEDRKGNIWVGTSNGVHILNMKNDEVSHKSIGKHVETHLSTINSQLYSNEIRTMFKDSKDNMYIAETGEGFAIVDGKIYLTEQKIELKHYTTEDSLVNNMIQCFVEDREGFVWIATEFGVSKFNSATGSIKNYFFSKNMINNVYSENCGILLEDGRIAFGTNNGIILITPSVYNKGEKSTDISADDITVNGQRKSGIVYVVSKWWKSPWAIACYLLIAVLIYIIRRRIRRNNKRLHKAIKELNIKKDILVSENIQLNEVNEELNVTNLQLSEVNEQLNAEKEEIKEQYSAEVRIKREEEKSAQDEEFIKKVEMIANNEMARADFTSDDFAEQMGMGRTVFFSKMKKITGYSPKEYIKLKRIKRAAELISTTNMPIGEIGFSVGIEDPLYFSRVFKQVYGVPPSEWRKKEQ